MSKYTRQEIEQSLSRNQLKPLCKKEYKGMHIWVMEGWRNDNQKEFPWGYYQGGYMIGYSDEKPDIAQEVMFDAMHDPQIPYQDKQRARVNHMLENARKAIDKLQESGYFRQ